MITLLRIARNPGCLKSNALPKPLNDTIMILGNGPSLKEVLEEQKEKLQSCDLFAVNKFCLSEAYAMVRPLHYIIVDLDFFQDTEDVNLMKMKEDVKRRFKEDTHWKMNLFLPRSDTGKNYAEQLRRNNANISIYFFNILTIAGPDSFRNKLYENGVGMPFVGNVLIAAIMNAINMGYKKIELYGAEHSIHTQAYINDKNQVALEYSYFDGSSAEFVFWDDIDPSKPQTYHQFLTHWTDTFKAYHEIEGYASYKGDKIINCTENSYIDAFERASV